eukprot:scaffold1542_cov125-Amphora_coffeaeformis.AAC.2
MECDLHHVTTSRKPVKRHGTITLGIVALHAMSPWTEVSRGGNLPFQVLEYLDRRLRMGLGGGRRCDGDGDGDMLGIIHYLQTPSTKLFD